MSKNTNIADLINYISVDGSGNVVLTTGGQVATQSYVTTAVSNLVNAAPSTLDTLNELAAALGNDANFATTVTNSIATRLPLAGGTLTGDLRLSYSYPRIYLIDTNNNSDYSIINADGIFTIYDDTNSSNRLTIASSGAATFSSSVSATNGYFGTSTIVSSSNANILQIGNNGIIENVVGNQMMIANNAYYTGSAWNYLTTGHAQAIRFGAQAAGDISFHSAPSGTAGSNMPNWDTTNIRMYITPSGNIGLNTISPVGGAGAGDRTFGINAVSGSAAFLTGMVGGIRYSTLFTGSSSVVLETNAEIPLVFNTNNTEAIRITSIKNLTFNGTNVPSGLVQEVGGTTPLLGLDVNFRPGSLINTSFPGAQVRVDMRSGQPPFSFLYRAGGSTTDSVLLQVREDGLRLKNGGSSLSYYEEGNWTPQLYWGNGGQYIMNASNAGRYVRIGNLVHLQFQLMWGSYNGGASGGTLRVGGIPFVAGGSCRSAGSICANNSIILSSGFTWLGLTIDPNANFIYIIQNLPGGGYSHDPGVNSSGIVYSLTITYSVS